MRANILKLLLLGPPLIELGSEPVDGFVSEKALLLLGYLAVQHSHQARDHLAGFFWGDMSSDRAKANLRMAIYNLQQLFPGYLQANRLYVSFNHELDYWLDVEQFEQGLVTIPASFPPPIESLQAALSLYRGEFLEGIHLGDSPELEEWLLVERERLRRIVLEGYQRYADALITAGQYAQAVQTIQQILRLEPWHESAHRQMMLALAHTGDFTGALEQFEVCRRILAEELGVEPMAETTRLYQRIREVRDLPFRHNLPVLTSPFFGREDAIQDLSRLLHDPHNRLITITGPGGAGKSRLALELASHFVNTFLHGVYLVPLASLESGDDLPSAVGRALGLSFTGKEDPERQVLHSLAQKELLLVLDNGEHVPNLADFASAILQAAPQVKILATAQERLDVREELVYEVGGLTHPLALLGYLLQGPVNGYQLHQMVNDPDGLGPIWRLKQSQLYALVSKLEQDGYIRGEIESQEPTRPPRKMYSLTPNGRAAFRSWLRSPVNAHHQMRQEFMAKLYFARLEGEKQVQDIIDAQRAACQKWLESISAEKAEPASFKWFLCQYRTGQIKADISWLENDLRDL